MPANENASTASHQPQREVLWTPEEYDDSVRSHGGSGMQICVLGFGLSNRSCESHLAWCTRGLKVGLMVWKEFVRQYEIDSE